VISKIRIEVLEEPGATIFIAEDGRSKVLRKCEYLSTEILVQNTSF
jgi:hypothetical protein